MPRQKDTEVTETESNGLKSIADLAKALNVDAQTIQSYIRQNEAAQEKVAADPSKATAAQKAAAEDPFPGTKEAVTRYVYKANPDEAIAWLRRTEDRKRQAAMEKYGRFTTVPAPETEVATA